MALCAGACLCLVARDDLVPGEPLLRTLRDLTITHATLPPVALSALTSTDGLEGLNTLIVAGEASSAALVGRWAAGRQLINAYGPTEATVCATLHLCDPAHRESPPIGRPISNTRIYILDDWRRPVPVGVPGEIYIGGAGVARGYLNRPELTAERFVVSSFTAIPPERLYKTGDLGRWRADGTIDYLGRNDHQVKIRGFRIELGEIEGQLARHALVKEAVVLAREDAPGDKRLVAYVILRSQSEEGAPVKVEELRAYLKASLPEHMIPSAFVVLLTWPVTPNGKLDRRALPAPELNAFATREYERPEGTIEESLADIWQGLLGVSRVGRRDNWFELGGHSLQLIKLVVGVAERFDVRVSVPAVFRYPTLQEMAQMIESLCLVKDEPMSSQEAQVEEGVI